MNFEFANSLSGYIETLYFINKNIIKLSGRDAFYYDNSEKLVLDIMQDIPRIIPYKYDKKSNKLILNDKDGVNVKMNMYNFGGLKMYKIVHIFLYVI